MNIAHGDARESAVSAGLNAQLREERRRAAAALLTRPLLLSAGRGAEIFLLVRRHADWLREWFGRHCGWALHVESDLARLRKTPADTADATRPLLDGNNRPFTRRRYVLLCLALAALEKSERQTVLSKLAEEMKSRFAMEPRLVELGLGFDTALRDHRRDLIEVIRFLISMNLLAKVDGDEQQYLSSGRDVLYNVNMSVLASLPNFRRGPSTISASTTDARIASMVDEPQPDTEDARNRRLRIGLFRKLLDDPVIYYADLDDDEKAYLMSQRPSIVREIESATGLMSEARKEGIAMVDPDDQMRDVAMPEEGTDGHITLLVAEHLAMRLRGGETAPLPIAAIEAHVVSLIPRHRTHWRKEATEPGAAHSLVADAIARLEKLRLIVHDAGSRQVTPRPAIGRFSLGELRTESADEPALWERTGA